MFYGIGTLITLVLAGIAIGLAVHNPYPISIACAIICVGNFLINLILFIKE